MATITEDVKSNFRTALENNTGVVGQALRDRREKANHDKEVAEQVSKIDQKTVKVNSDGKAISKMEIAFTQISQNFQLINKWADAQVTTHDETIQAISEQKQTQAEIEKKQQLNIQVPKLDEDKSIFDSILGMFSNLVGKIKGKFPKGLKGKGMKGGGAPKGKAGILKKVGAFAARNAGTILAGSAVVGTIIAAKSGSFQSKDQKEAAEADKQQTKPQDVDYNIEPEAPKNVKEQPAAAPVVTPPPPPPPPAPVQTPAYACTCPPPQKTAASKPAATPPPVSLPSAAPPPAEKGKSGYQGQAPQPVAAPAPAAAAPAPSVSPAPTPMAAPMAAGKSSDTPPPATASSLSSVVKLAAPDVSLDGMQGAFEKTVATMAAAFKQQTGKTLLVTSGIRSNEKQKQLFDAKVAQLGGNVAAAKKLVAEPMAPLGQGKGSMHLKGLAIDINSKGDAGINMLAGTRDAPTGWLEKFGLTRPVPNEDWHVQLSGSPPTGDVGGVPGKDGNPVDPSTGKPLPVPKDPTTGQKLMDSSKTVAQIKHENSQPGTTTVVIRDTKEVTDYQRKKQSHGQATATAGA